MDSPFAPFLFCSFVLWGIFLTLWKSLHVFCLFIHHVIIFVGLLIALKFMLLLAALMPLLAISLLAFFLFGTTLAKKKDGRAFFGRHFQLHPRLEYIFDLSFVER